MPRPLLRPSLPVLAMLTLAGIAHAQPCATPSKLISPSPATSDLFGSSVSMSFGGPNNRPLLAIGKPFEDSPAGAHAGGWSVWQYANGSWSLAYDAWNATGQAFEEAGMAIAISDPYMIVGAPGYEQRGRALVLRRSTNSNTWLLDDTLSTGIVSGSTFSRYGSSVAISAANGVWAIVGAPNFGTAGIGGGIENSGRVDLYYRDSATGNWINSHTMEGLGAGYGTVNGHLGTSVAISQTSDWAVWGAPGETSNPGFPRSGLAYVRGRTAFNSLLIAPPVHETDLRFGTAVAIEGEWMAIGAPGENGSSAETGLPNDLLGNGAVYLYHFENGEWVLRGTLRAPLPLQGGNFGLRLSMSSTQLVVGEQGTNRVFVYHHVGGNTWSVQSTFQDPENSNAYGFGQSLAVRDGLVAIGDLYDDPNGLTDAGAVYTANVATTFANGDTCRDPLPMPTSDFVGCTETATPSAGNVTTCGLGGSGQGPDVWFRFQPTCSGNATIDTWGSDFDTVLSVHNTCPDASAGHSIACNDDAGFPAPNNRISLVTFNFTGGQTYLVRVSGYNGASGQFTLRSLVSYGVNNDTCATAPTIAQGVQHTFNTCSATDSSGPVSLGTIHDIWYRFIAPSTGSYNFSTCGSGFDSVITLFNGTQAACPTSPAAMIAQNDNNGICGDEGQQSFLTTTLTQGQSVMIRIGGAAPGDFGPGIFGIGQPQGCDDIDFNNNDLFPEDQDVIDFFAVLAGGACSTNNCNDIDFNNNDLYPEDQDIVDFLTVLAGGTCVR